MTNLLYNNTIKRFFLIFALLHVFANDLSAFDEDDEYMDEDQENVECFSRYAFPTTCAQHFTNNIGIEQTWVEAESPEIIDSFSGYIRTIPKIYAADCCQCFDCQGVNFNLYRGCDDPTEVDAFEELSKGHVQSRRGYGKHCKRNSDHCESLCWNGGYFRLWNHKYLHFFKHYLQYCSENARCRCYWPECDLDAANINNSVYELIKDLADEGLITYELSSYWQAKIIDFDYDGKIYTDLYYPNSHGIASSLTTYTFFYSQYHQMLLSIAEFIDVNSVKGNSEALDRIYAILEQIRDQFITQFNGCIRAHAHPKIYYERGMLQMHSGRTEEALMDVNRLMRMAQTDRYKDKTILTSEMYQQEGEIYADLGKYDKAIASLSEAIRLDPNNRGAYFNRAQVYFESGEFEQSLGDYLRSKSHDDSPKTKLKPSKNVKESILNGLQEGCLEAVVDFVPSMCSSVYGLCSSMWAFVEHPIDCTTEFVNACYDIGKCVNEFRKNVDLDEIESYPPEVQRLYDQFERLSDSEKGHLVGYITGRYGVDIFAGATAIKGIAALKKLRDANRMCMLETMAISETNKEAIIASALKHNGEREAFFKNVKLHVDRQNKHIVGKHNFELGKSIFEHPDSQGLINKFAGKGEPIKGRIPGHPDYREKVNFGEHIGYHVNKDTGVKTATTWGEIRYSKDGAHIVPVYPK